MKFRPCIDIHNGKVKQIVGGSLKDQGNQANENFVSEQDASYYAQLYKEKGITGGHVILLNKKDSEYKAAGAAGTFYVSGRTAGWRRYRRGKCLRISDGRCKPCDRDIVCVPGWPCIL